MQQLNDYNRTVGTERAASFVLIPTNNTNLLSTAPTNFFKLGPGDVIQIEMLGEAEGPAVQTVGPDGKIYYNLLPGLFVWGMTLSEVKTALENALAKSLKLKPEIAVTLNNAQSGKVWVLGSVQRSGVYSLASSLTLLEVIALAGGLNTIPGSTEEVVDLANSFIMRKGEPLRVNFYALLRKGDLSQNIYLQPDDFIYFRPAATRQIYVLGAVVQPNVLDFTPGMTLLSAISRVGGPAPYAESGQVGIVRGSLTSPSVTDVNYKAIAKGHIPDFPVEAGDIVYVPFSRFMKVERLGDQILRQFVQTIAANEGQRAVNRNASPIQVTAPVPAP
ncbi:MAG: polysaccharide export protein Wza [Verrucomicrobiales bacterium]|nr:polysaccharide export protein Wza [Verrucomicrobiales bacterium]